MKNRRKDEKYRGRLFGVKIEIIPYNKENKTLYEINVISNNDDYVKMLFSKEKGKIYFESIRYKSNENAWLPKNSILIEELGEHYPKISSYLFNEDKVKKKVSLSPKPKIKTRSNTNEKEKVKYNTKTLQTKAIMEWIINKIYTLP